MFIQAKRYCVLAVFVIHQVIKGRFLHRVFTSLAVTARNSQAVPVFIIQLHEVAAVVVTRPASFFTEQRMLEHTLGSTNAMV